MNNRDRKEQDRKGTVTGKDNKDRGIEKLGNPTIGEGSGLKKDDREGR